MRTSIPFVKQDAVAPKVGGEPPITATGAVIANAVFDAAGVRMLHLPMQPERVRGAMAARRRVPVHGLGRCLATATLGVAITLGLSATSPLMAQPAAPSQQLTPLVSPGSSEHHVGKVVLMQLVTPDLATAKRFYGGLFGWRFRDLKLGGEDYAEATLDQQLVAGLLHKALPAGERRQSSWLAFLAVRDVDATKKLALANGAKVLREPHTVQNRGREAVFSDPQGAVFAVLASSSGDPPDELADPGEWIWASLSTPDPDTNAGFYQTLFDYEVFDLPADAGARHLMLATDSYARASANTLPKGPPGARPHWMNYVHVEDVAAASARVQALGGRVLVAPRADRHGGRVAIVADPLGAAFGLLEWPDVQGKEPTP